MVVSNRNQSNSVYQNKTRNRDKVSCILILLIFKLPVPSNLYKAAIKSWVACKVYSSIFYRSLSNGRCFLVVLTTEVNLPLPTMSNSFSLLSHPLSLPSRGQQMNTVFKVIVAPRGLCLGLSPLLAHPQSRIREAITRTTQRRTLGPERTKERATSAGTHVP